MNRKKTYFINHRFYKTFGYNKKRETRRNTREKVCEVRGGKSVHYITRPVMVYR